MPDADTPENRLSMAYGKCQQAEELLALAQQHQSNPGLIKQAIDLYIEVMSMEDVELAEPYLGIAYLAFSAGDLEKTWVLLNTAQQIDPANIRVSQLRHRIEAAAARGAKNHAKGRKFKKLQSSKSEYEARQMPPALMQNVMETKAPQVAAEAPLAAEAMPAATLSAAAASPAQTAPAETSSVQGAPPPLVELPGIDQLLGPSGKGEVHQGAQIELLQNWLRLLGHDKVQTSSVYDKATLNAVQTFQMKHRLRISGLVDSKTAALLKQLVQQQSAPLKR
ncbi:MAG: peptidoglycan-binding protein [Candidatus Sericytochromatia bacterium]